MQRFLILLLLVYATSCGYAERNHPEKYLIIVSEPWEGQSSLELEIVNTAEHTDYENIHIHITYFENGRKVGTDEATHWGIISAKSNSLLKAKIYPPPTPVHPNEITFEISAHVVDKWLNDFFLRQVLKLSIKSLRTFSFSPSLR